MARCRYRGQYVEETNCMNALGKREERLQTEDKDLGGQSAVEGEKIRGVEGTASVGRKPATKKAVPKLHLSW